MATLREAIKTKINGYVSEQSVLLAEHNAKQAEINEKIKIEEDRLNSLGVFLDQEVGEAKKGLAALFSGYEPVVEDEPSLKK